MHGVIAVMPEQVKPAMRASVFGMELVFPPPPSSAAAIVTALRILAGAVRVHFRPQFAALQVVLNVAPIYRCFASADLLWQLACKAQTSSLHLYRYAFAVTTPSLRLRLEEWIIPYRRSRRP